MLGTSPHKSSNSNYAAYVPRQLLRGNRIYRSNKKRVGKSNLEDNLILLYNNIRWLKIKKHLKNALRHMILCRQNVDVYCAFIRHDLPTLYGKAEKDSGGTGLSLPEATNF